MWPALFWAVMFTLAQVFITFNWNGIAFLNWFKVFEMPQVHNSVIDVDIQFNIDEQYSRLSLLQL